eukprot:TRINITY_DN3992_c0_g1_i2.p1 TRINITY_DN3992_c0_g1~~TRINITY_DN3992_c0_g1_i2.p1  ORF type:complete len:149 (-),score=17.56 TRINITY_DN3992_c0_g1_i2:292-738(-)
MAGMLPGVELARRRRIHPHHEGTREPWIPRPRREPSTTALGETVLRARTRLEQKLRGSDSRLAFLNGGIEEVHVEQAQGYMVKGKEENAYQLKKALYGLKQARRAWNGKIDKYFCQDKMKRSPSEPPLYVKEGADGVKNSLAKAEGPK